MQIALMLLVDEVIQIFVQIIYQYDDEVDEVDDELQQIRIDLVELLETDDDDDKCQHEQSI